MFLNLRFRKSYLTHPIGDIAIDLLALHSRSNTISNDKLVF